MARLEFIQYDFEPLHVVDYRRASGKREGTPKLPQIFWDDGSGWSEANVWALERQGSQLDSETIKRTMKHLCSYANFLESRSLSWQHFPVKAQDRAPKKFRKHLIDEMEQGSLANSTASNCINAVVQFYRFAKIHNLVGAKGPLWDDHMAVIRYHDSAGFERALVRLSSDLAISNRARIGTVLEDGLLPLSAQHMSTLLIYTSQYSTAELHLMLSTGFFTGARVGTVTTLTVSSLETAREDPQTPGIYLLPVGPGTKVATKFSVTGNLLVPAALLADLKSYATSTSRLLREAKASRTEKDRLFLGRSGKPYSVGTVNRLVHEMRNKALIAGLKFMQKFKFHQSRATFGTWLLQLLLNHVSPTIALGFVKDAMLHKDERVTMRYITFNENTRAKGEFAIAFNEAFTGLRDRDWNQTHA